MVRKNNSYKTILKICIIGAFIILKLVDLEADAPYRGGPGYI